MSHYCLDSSAYSHFKRGHPPVVEILDRARWVGVPSVTVGELWIGFLQGNKVEHNAKDLAEFLSHPVVEELTVDRETAEIYAEIVVALRKAGTPVPSNDIWIAAAAARARSTVLTYDPHFANIQRVVSIVLPSPFRGARRTKADE
jgi:tRNA(fMet)-specific endonuclease VapC